jgi:ubiquinone/menaquinone biosynthesis C-methylase UbiE
MANLSYDLVSLRKVLGASEKTVPISKLDDYTLLVFFYPQYVLGVARKRLQEMSSYLKPGLILEAGSGRGWLSLQLSKKGYSIIDVDLSDARISQAKALYKSEQVEIPIIKASLINLPLKDGTFSSVVSCDVVEHIPTVETAFAELNRVMVENGHLCLTIPNGYGSFGIINDIILPGIGRGDKGIEGEHVQKFTANSMKTLIEFYNFKLIKFVNLEMLTSFYASVFRLLKFKRTDWQTLENTDAQTSEKVSNWLGSVWIIICKKEKSLLN